MLRNINKKEIHNFHPIAPAAPYFLLLHLILRKCIHKNYKYKY